MMPPDYTIPPTPPSPEPASLVLDTPRLGGVQLSTPPPVPPPATQPNAIAFKTRFPEFASVSDTLVEFALEEASLFVQNWNARGMNIAWMYLAAHIVAISSIAADTEGRDIVSETIGRLATTYRSAGANLSLGDLTTTAYGKRYQQIRALSFGPPFRSVRDRFASRYGYGYGYYDGWYGWYGWW